MYSLEEFDKEKIRVLKYIMFKKRSEYEIRNKYSKSINEELLNDIIDYLKEAGYINDNEYIERSVNEYMILKNLSLKELKYKLIAKGINRNLLEDYFYEHQEELEEYEIKSSTNIVYKKQNTMDQEEIKQYLFKKGYKYDNINIALQEYKKEG